MHPGSRIGRLWDVVVGGSCIVLGMRDVTDAEVESLRTAAGQAGDLEQVAICERALDGDAAARAICADAIVSWEAEQAARRSGS